MRAVLALLLLAYSIGAANAAPLDDWCAQVTVPSSIAICSDPELRALAIERQHAFDEARGRVGEARYGVLVADQKAWVASYPRACGVMPDTPPQLPLSPPVRDCMANAGRSRIAYLRAYGIPASDASNSTAATAGERIGPGFDCGAVTALLARLICSDVELSKTDLLFNQAYHALHQALDPDGRRRLAVEDIEFLNSVKLACGMPETGAVAGSRECVVAHFNQKRSEWISRLSGAAYEEANRRIEQHVALQARLQRLGFLPPTAKIDGVYSSATRSAILAWQTASNRPVTGLMSNSDATAIGAPVVPPQATTSPSLQASARPPPRGGADAEEVALKLLGGTYLVPVRINDAITLNFMVDSGASDVLIPADVVMTLFRTETLTGSDFIGERNYVLADGSKLPSARFLLRELKVGNHLLANVTASVGPVAGEPLLGQSFLSRFRSWTLDNAQHALILIER